MTINDMYTFKNRSYGLFVKNLVLKTYFNDQWRKRCPEQYIMHTYSTVSSGYAVISSMTLQDIIKMKWPNLSEKRSTIASIIIKHCTCTGFASNLYHFIDIFCFLFVFLFGHRIVQYIYKF